MGTVKTEDGIRQVCALWRDALEQTSDDTLRAATAPGEWTLGQVYAHIVDATDGMVVPQIEKCLSVERTAAKKGKTLAGFFVFALGRIPPVRIRFQPIPGYAPKQPRDGASIRSSLDAMEARLLDLVARASSAPRDRRARHPLLGMLNAGEWLQFAQMHLHHHLRQRRRLEQLLKRRV